MDETEASSSKAKIDQEAPSQWMVEFLLKMKQEIKEEILEELTNLPRIDMQGHSTTIGKVDENQCQANANHKCFYGEVIHSGSFCDNCDQLIHGIRYKCGNCADFDLCQECESLPNIHNKNHIFLKIRYPVPLKLFQKQKGQTCDLPSANELLTPALKSHSPKKLYEAKFVCDETVPDGTVLYPSIRFIKSWRVLNTGKRVWTHNTKLLHIQGSGLTPASEQVDVPHLRPGEEGIVSVPFTTPAVPGVYRSHWNFCHKSRPFGHIVWCHIVVKDLDSEEKQLKKVTETLELPASGLPSEKEKEVASIAKVLTAVKEEHERGNMIPRKLAVNSHTATPNNTPFDLTPPKSPDHHAMNELKEVVDDKETVPVTVPVVDYDPEEEGSVVSLSSSDSDAEFVVIPMPNCFNLSEPFVSHNMSHLSQYLQSENVGDQKDSKGSMQKVKLQTLGLNPAFSTEVVSQETGVPELSETPNEVEQKVAISHTVSADGSSSEISIIESGASSPTVEDPMPEISSIHIAVTSDIEPRAIEKPMFEDIENSVQQEDPEKEEEATHIPGSSATFPKFPVEGITSIYEPASSNTEERTVQVLPERIVTVPLNVASTVYNAAKVVMTNYLRGQSDGEGRYNPEGATSSALNPMDQLAEMGFCNRQQNEELLKKHKNDVALVVGELVNVNDNDWYASRHVPPTAPTYN